MIPSYIDLPYQIADRVARDLVYKCGYSEDVAQLIYDRLIDGLQNTAEGELESVLKQMGDTNVQGNT